MPTLITKIYKLMWTDQSMFMMLEIIYFEVVLNNK